MEPLEDNDPREVGRFKIIARLGSGGMGRVYLARAANGQQFALKMIHQFVAEDAQFRRRFHREVAAARRVTGPNTAALVDADPDARPPWMAVEFVDGPTLSELIERGGPLTAASCVRLASGMAQALLSIHGAGLVHRDLKPSNVLMGADGARLIDFGIAQSSDASSVLTMTGLVTGSAGFMSPEQAQAEYVTEASDVFALGAVLFFAATGQRAFGEGSLISVTYRVVHADPNLAGIRDEGLRALIADCLMKDAARRPTPQQVYDRCPGILDGSWRTGRPARTGAGAANVLALTGPMETTTPGGGQAARWSASPTSAAAAAAAQGPATESFTPPFAPQPGVPATGAQPTQSYGQGPLPQPPQGYGQPPQSYEPQGYDAQGYEPQGYDAGGYNPRPPVPTSRREEAAVGGWFADLRRRNPRAWLALPVGAAIVLAGGAAVAVNLVGGGATNNGPTDDGGGGQVSTSTRQPALPGSSPTGTPDPGEPGESEVELPPATHYPTYSGPTTRPTSTPTGKPTSTPSSTKGHPTSPTRSASGGPKPPTGTSTTTTEPPTPTTTTASPSGGPSISPTTTNPEIVIP